MSRMRLTPPSPFPFSVRGRVPPGWAALAAVLLLAGCGDSGPAEPTVDGVVVREIILEGDDGSWAFSHIDHWHGAPLVREGGSVGITMHFTDRQLPPDDHDIPPVEHWFSLADHPDHSVRVVIEDTTMARWTGDRVRGTLQGRSEGASRMSFVVLRGSTTIYEAPPLNFRVQPPLE